MKFVLKNAHISGVSISNGPGECASSQVTKTLKKNKKTLNGDICCLDVDRRSKQTFIHIYVQLLDSIRASKNNETANTYVLNLLKFVIGKWRTSRSLKILAESFCCFN